MECQGHLLPSNGPKCVSIALLAGRKFWRTSLSVHTVCGPCSTCQVLLADGNTVQRPPLLPLFSGMLFPGRGPLHALFPSGAWPHAYRNTTLFLAPGALCCEAPRQQGDAWGSKFRGKQHWPRLMQERKPGSWTVPLSMLAWVRSLPCTRW